MEYIKPERGLDRKHAANAGFDFAVRAGDLVFITGQVAVNEKGELVGPNDFEKQAMQVHENLRTVCIAAGGTLEDIVEVRLFIVDLAHKAVLNAVRKRYHPGPNFPASTLLVVAGLANPDYLLEISAVAYIPR